MFVPGFRALISYASSFGVSQIPWYQVKRTAEYLNRLDFISMRENRGSQIVKELTGKEVPTILDPVFSFDMAGWEKLVPAKKNMSEPHSLCLTLGANPAYRKAVEELSQKTRLKNQHIRHPDQSMRKRRKFESRPRFTGTRRIRIDSRCKVKLIRFHGTCFSIIQ